MQRRGLEKLPGHEGLNHWRHYNLVTLLGGDGDKRWATSYTILCFEKQNTFLQRLKK